MYDWMEAQASFSQAVQQLGFGKLHPHSTTGIGRLETHFIIAYIPDSWARQLGISALQRVLAISGSDTRFQGLCFLALVPNI